MFWCSAQDCLVLLILLILLNPIDFLIFVRVQNSMILPLVLLSTPTLLQIPWVMLATFDVSPTSHITSLMEWIHSFYTDIAHSLLRACVWQYDGRRYVMSQLQGLSFEGSEITYTALCIKTLLHYLTVWLGVKSKQSSLQRILIFFILFLRVSA